MDSDTYPGKGLSLPQLVFALNKELRRATHSSFFSLDAVSQLDHDISDLLAAIREWRNSFSRINRVPLDVLSLIPTYLSPQTDLIRATFVCRHWRKTFLQHGALWSKLFVKKCPVHVKTILERAKGSALDVFINRGAPVSAVILVSPSARQIRSLEFKSTYWAAVPEFCEAVSGPFPLLRTLKLSILTTRNQSTQLNSVTTPSPPLFRSAENLEEFVFSSARVQFLNLFIFPNLITFKLSTCPGGGLNASDLFNFLKASPTLQILEMKVFGSILLEGVTRETIVVLPNVEALSLFVCDDTHIYDFATHLSCPRVEYASLTRDIYNDEMTPDVVVFPASALWSTIAHQYMRGPAEEVTLETNPIGPTGVVGYSLIFRSSDASVLRLRLGVRYYDADEDDVLMSPGEIELEAFSQACRTIRDHPLLSHIKYLHIKHGNRNRVSDTEAMASMAEDTGDLFKSLGPLDELTIHGGDLPIYLAPFLNPPEFGNIERVFPPVKWLVISCPWTGFDDEGCMEAIMELAKSQHGLGIPFERVTIRTRRFSMVLAEGFKEMVEGLKQWVATVDFSELNE